MSPTSTGFVASPRAAMRATRSWKGASAPSPSTAARAAANGGPKPRLPTPLGAVLREDLAVAGRTGTLSARMRRTAAAGRCQAKTGTLTGASNLAGYCVSANGHVLAFAIFTDGIATRLAHTLQDHLAI